jgi:hypothetical protein
MGLLGWTLFSLAVFGLAMFVSLVTSYLFMTRR